MTGDRWGLTVEQMVAYERGVGKADAAKRVAAESADAPLADLVRVVLKDQPVTVEQVDHRVIVHGDACLGNAVDELVPLHLQVFVEACEMDGEHLVVMRMDLPSGVGSSLNAVCVKPEPARRSDGRKFSSWLSELVAREAVR